MSVQRNDLQFTVINIKKFSSHHFIAVIDGNRKNRLADYFL